MDRVAPARFLGGVGVDLGGVGVGICVALAWEIPT